MPGELEAKALLSRADAAMYRAKRDGRNCVRVWEDYPEWRRSQVRAAPSGVDTPGEAETKAPESSPALPDWRILTDGPAGDQRDEGASDESDDDWDEI